jgi:RNA polymerase sigma-70 factor (ECF subfamily)
MSLPINDALLSQADLESQRELIADEEIVERVIAGEVALFELIMRRYNQRLFRIARSILGDKAEAEDVVQEAYVRAFKNLRQYQARARFATWLTKIAVYEASARRRKRRGLQLIEPAESESSFMVQSNPDGVVEAVSRKELNGVLKAAVEALPVELRVVFTMREVEQLSTDETAECLELTPSNVKVRLHRARMQLQSWIDRQIGREARELYMFAGERCDRIVANVMARINSGEIGPL